MQIRKRFDTTTLCKIGKAFLISLTAGAGAGFIALSAQMTLFFISKGVNPIDWYLVGGAFWFPFSSAIVASYLQWKKGVPPETLGETPNQP